MEGHRQWRLYERYTIPPSTMSTTPHTHLSLTSVRNQNQDYCAQGHKAAQLSVISLEEGEMYYVTWVPGSEKANNPRSNRYSMPDNLRLSRLSPTRTPPPPPRIDLHKTAQVLGSTMLWLFCTFLGLGSKLYSVIYLHLVGVMFSANSHVSVQQQSSHI